MAGLTQDPGSMQMHGWNADMGCDIVALPSLILPNLVE